MMIDSAGQGRPYGPGRRVSFDLLLVAAGLGERLGRDLPKAMVHLAGIPMFLHPLRLFAAIAGLRHAILLGPPDPKLLREMQAAAEAGLGTFAASCLTVLPGGARRQDSVREGLRFLSGQGADPSGIVLIHDAARPLLEPDLVHRCLQAMCTTTQEPDQAALPGIAPDGSWGAGPAGVVPAIPVRETLKLVYEGRVVLTQPRENLHAVQTPQAFRLGPLLEAHNRAVRRTEDATDDAALLEWQGIPVHVIPGQATNLKITYPGDHDLAERLLRPVAVKGEEAL